MGRDAASVARYMLAKYGARAEVKAFGVYSAHWGKRNKRAMAFWERVVEAVKREEMILKRGEV